jgi:hypothetical protein
MALEITLVDQLEVNVYFFSLYINLFLQETIQTFERNLGEMVSNFTESMRGNFSQIRDLQAYFNESIVTLCVATVERVMKGELEDEFPDDTREV